MKILSDYFVLFAICRNFAMKKGIERKYDDT